MPVSSPTYTDNVFINCPFDADYLPLLYAITYTVYRCGLFPLTAMNEDNGTDNRIDKISRIIEKCKYGIHDISRTELNPDTDLPRFNMPLELGLFFGAQKFGDQQQKSKNALILDVEKYRYLEFITDIRGIDIKAHNNSTEKVIQRVRDWIKTATGKSPLSGHILIASEYTTFMAGLPTMVERMGLDPGDIPYTDFCEIVSAAAQLNAEV